MCMPGGYEGPICRLSQDVTSLPCSFRQLDFWGYIAISMAQWTFKYWVPILRQDCFRTSESSIITMLEYHYLFSSGLAFALGKCMVGASSTLCEPMLQKAPCPPASPQTGAFCTSAALLLAYSLDR